MSDLRWLTKFLLLLAALTALANQPERAIEAKPPLDPNGEDVPPLQSEILHHWRNAERPLYSVSWHQSWTALDSGSSGNLIKLWDAKTGAMLRAFAGRLVSVKPVSFGPEGMTLAAGSADNTVKLWDANTGVLFGVLEGHTAEVRSVSFSTNGAILASASEDKTIKLWDPDTRALLGTLEGHTAAVNAVNINPDPTSLITARTLGAAVEGALLVSGSDDKTVKLWDLKTGNVLHTFEGHLAAVTAVNLSQDGKTVISGSEDKTIKLWDAKTGKLLHTFEAPVPVITSVCLSPDGKAFTFGSDDNCIRRGDAKSGASKDGWWWLNEGLSHALSPWQATSQWGYPRMYLQGVKPEPMLRILEGHSDQVWSVSLSADGSSLVTGSYDNTAKLWDAKTGNLLHTFEGKPVDGQAIVRSVSLSLDGEILAAGGTSHGDIIMLWNTKTRALLDTFKASSYQVSSVRLNQNGSILASSSGPTVQLWDVKTGELLHTLEGHTDHVTDRVTSISLSSDGSILASALSKVVQLWDVKTGALLRTFEGHSAYVLSVSLSQDGALLASSSEQSHSLAPQGNAVKLWDVKTGALLRTFEVFSQYQRSVSLSQDGSILAASSDNATIRLWNAQTGKLLHTLTKIAGLKSVSLSSDGDLLAAATGRAAKLWSVKTGKLLHTFEGRPPSAVISLSFSANGAFLASLESAGKTAKLWNAKTGALLRTFESNSDYVRSVSLSGDGAVLALGSDDTAVKLWDAKTGLLLHALEGHDEAVRSVSLSGDAAILASASKKAVKLWDVKNRALLHTFQEDSASVLSIGLSADGSILALGLENGPVKLWDVQTGALLHTLEEHSNGVSSVSFSQDGSLLIAVSFDRTAMLWDTKTGVLLHTFKKEPVLRYNVTAASLSPNGATLALGWSGGWSDNTMELWDTQTGLLLNGVKGTAAVSSVSFSPDGATLAVGYHDNTINLWDMQAGKLKMQLQAFPDGDWLAYHADGKLFRADGKARVQVRASASEPWRLLPPPQPKTGKPKLVIQPVRQPMIPHDAAEIPDALVTIRNEGDASAFWIHLELNGIWPEGWFVYPKSSCTRLDPGQTAQLAVHVSKAEIADPNEPGISPKLSRPMKLQGAATSFYTVNEPVTFNLPIQEIQPQISLKSLEIVKNIGPPPKLLVVLENAPDALDLNRFTVLAELLDRQSKQKLLTLGKALPVASLPAGQTSKVVSFSLLRAFEGANPKHPITFLDELMQRQGPLNARITVQSSIWPTHRWVFEQPIELSVDPPLTLSSKPTNLQADSSFWLFFSIGLGVFLLLAACVYRIRFRKPDGP